jgi:hypothetical protein
VGTRAEAADDPDLRTLVGEIAGQTERLLLEQFELLKEETRQTIREAGGAVAAAGAGVGLLAVGGVLSTAAAVHLLHRLTRLPLWGCYGLAAGAAGAAGVGLLAAARAKAARLQRPLLPRTTATLQDNVTWLRKQLTTTPA